MNLSSFKLIFGQEGKCQNKNFTFKCSTTFCSKDKNSCNQFYKIILKNSNSNLPPKYC